jgi:acetyl esterase/lipase
MTNVKKPYDTSRITIQRQYFERNMALLFPTHSVIKRSRIASVPVAWIGSTTEQRTIIYLHGGGFTFGSPRSHLQHMARLAKMCDAKVLAIDYGLAPENPYPVALKQIQRVWEALLQDKMINTSKVVIAGDSAGGGLALASVMRFRDAGLPQPACVVLLSPALDATFSGNSYTSKSSKDVVLNSVKLEFFASTYAQQHSRYIPFISPVYADLKGLPPLLIHIGSEEMLLSDSETVAKHAKRDGVQATLFVGEGMWHGWHLFASYVPEAKAAMQSVAKYILSHS